MPRPNMEWLRGEARRLLLDLKAHVPQALQRLATTCPDRVMDPPVLALAQLIVAREHGFLSWPKMKQGVELVLSREAKSSRRQAEVEVLASELLAFAKQRDLAALTRALAVGKWKQVGVVERLKRRPAQWVMLIDALLSGLDDPRPRIRYECAHALDRFADSRSRVPLLRLMDDPVPRVRRMAMHALSCDQCKTDLFGDDDDVRHRLADRALHDESVQVRRHGAIALGYAGGEICASALTQLAADRDAVVRRNAHWALRKLNNRA